MRLDIARRDDREYRQYLREEQRCEAGCSASRMQEPLRIRAASMSTRPVRLHRWDEIALEKVTEMISRKVVTGEREMIGQIYLKRGALVPMHSHESEQLTYVLQGAMKFLIGGEEITVREGEVLHIPSWVPHQAEALEDTFEIDLFSPIRQDWLDGTDNYFHDTPTPSPGGSSS
jgi:quercetin dioxygenase-like cupin family protein